MNDDDSVKCPHCGYECHIGGLIGPTTDDCPRCGRRALYPPPKPKAQTMKPAELLSPQDAPALYFMQQTATLRERCDALTLALMTARDLLQDPDAEAEAADRVLAVINRTLEATA